MTLLSEVYLKAKEARQLLKLGSRQFWTISKLEDFPKRIYITPHSFRYKYSEIVQWMETRPRETTAFENSVTQLNSKQGKKKSINKVNS